MIVAVSDIHIGYEMCNKNDFDRFIKDVLEKHLGQNDHLVLIGDVLEFWRRNNVSVALDNQDIISKLQTLKTNVHYVIGNHDYIILRWGENFPFYPFKVSRSLRLSDGGKDFFFIHGYELEVLANLEPMTIEAYENLSEWLCQMTEEFFGSLLSRIWGALQVTLKKRDERLKMAESIVKAPQLREKMERIEKFAISDVKRLFLGIKKDERLVFGHTHKPFLEGNVANTGSWVSDADEYNTYLKIENGVMSLVKFS